MKEEDESQVVWELSGIYLQSTIYRSRRDTDH